MIRREFITLFGGAAAGWPIIAHAQKSGAPVIGFLSLGKPIANNLAGLSEGLSEQGYKIGRNASMEFREAEQYDQLPALAAELVRRRVAVIVTYSNFDTALAAKAATSTIPVVFTGGADPVSSGLVASLNRPGGNVTGVTYLTPELGPKRLELLREIVSRAATIAFLVNPANRATELSVRPMQSAAEAVGQKLVIVGASTVDEIDTVFAALAGQHIGGVMPGGDGFLAGQRDQLVALAARYKLPAIYFNRAFTEAGGLMSYSADEFDSWRQAGNYVGRILKGEKPADLPVQQPTTFEFVINLKTAKALGLTVPPTLRALASEVIE